MFKYGKLPVKEDSRTLCFSKYNAKLPPPPPQNDSSLYVFQDKLKVDPCNAMTYFPMDGNDHYGCCTCAAAYHLITLWEGIVGNRVVASAQDVVKTYQTLTGGPDTGLTCLDVLNYWKNTGIGDNKILAYVKVDHTNHTEIKQAISLFGAVYLGFDVQQNAQEDFNTQMPWKAGPKTGDGHCVVIVAYSPDYVRCLTWGNSQLGEWGWVDGNVVEAYAIIPQEANALHFALGFDIETLQADLQAIAEA